ncbi:MAG: hypothetical protein R2850_12930 [Bacteroidia bacterium]
MAAERLLASYYGQIRFIALVVQYTTIAGFINRCGYWKVERLAGSTNVTPTLGWSNNPCYSTSPVDASVAQWDGSTWKDKGNATSGTSTAGEVKSTAAITSIPRYF